MERYWEGAIRLRRELKQLTYPIKWITEAMDEAAGNNDPSIRNDGVAGTIKFITVHNEAADFQIDRDKVKLEKR